MWQQPVIEHMKVTEWGWIVAHPQNFVLGWNTDIGYGTYIACQKGVEIENDVKIGAGCVLYSADTEDNVYGNIVIKQGSKIGAGTIIFPNVIIGENVKIDARCVIKYGVSIGNNSKIGVMSYVKEDVPENEFWYGIPAVFHGRIVKREVENV